MKRTIVETKDGSKSIVVEAWDEQYHSRHGALQEAFHVFIDSGFTYRLANQPPAQLRILEVGFGTGLNALITFQKSTEENIKLHYTGLEAYPVETAMLDQMEYGTLVGAKELYNTICHAKWEEDVAITSYATLHKKQVKLQEWQPIERSFNLVYFDAFAPRVQPEMWETSVFEKLWDAMAKNGVLVTYCAKGQVRRNMQAAGFEVARIPGPPGKREMLRAVKT